MGGSLAAEPGSRVIWVAHWLQKGVRGFMGGSLATEGGQELYGWLSGYFYRRGSGVVWVAHCLKGVIWVVHWLQKGVRGCMDSSLSTEGGQGVIWVAPTKPSLSLFMGQILEKKNYY